MYFEFKMPIILENLLQLVSTKLSDSGNLCFRFVETSHEITDCNLIFRKSNSSLIAKLSSNVVGRNSAIKM